MLRLWLEQEGRCPVCKEMIAAEDEWDTHHIRPRVEGGGGHAGQPGTGASEVPPADTQPGLERIKAGDCSNFGKQAREGISPSGFRFPF